MWYRNPRDAINALERHFEGPEEENGRVAVSIKG